MLVINKSERAFVIGGEVLEPGKAIEIESKEAKGLLEAYPNELVAAESKSKSEKSADKESVKKNKDN